MKRLPLVIVVVMAVLGAVTSGCGGTHRYDSRLVAADSLMHDYPDSALSVLTAIDTVSLASEADRAYRDLLLTQARYKAYITATSDSDINRALAYYLAHPKEREKHTRAYIYKGAVMEELGHPDSAMIYYKQAEANAAPTDYINLGYTKMRMGSLLRDHYAYDGKGIVYFEEALDMFTRSGNIDYQHKCINNLGCLLRESNPQRADTLLRWALQISREKNDTNGILDDMHALIILYDENEEYVKALHLLNDVIRLGGEISFSFCTTAANVYAHNGMIDSALLFLDSAKRFNNLDIAKNRMYFLESQAAIAKAKGDYYGYLMFSQQEKHISDSLIANSPKPIIIQTESVFDKLSFNKATHGLSVTRIVLFFLFMAFVLYGIIMIYHNRKYSCKYRRIINQLKKEADGQLTAIDELNDNFEKLAINDLQLKEFISSQIEMLREITVDCYHEPRNKLAEQLMKKIKYQDNNQHRWSQLYGYLDAEYNDIMSFVRSNYPMLNDKELLLVALSCLDFSYIQIAIILGYNNPTSVGTMKLRVANKMGLTTTLNEYIAQKSKKQ